MENLCKYKDICEHPKRGQCGFEDEPQECNTHTLLEEIEDEALVNEFVNNVFKLCDQVEGEFPPSMLNNSNKVRDFIRTYNIQIRKG